MCHHYFLSSLGAREHRVPRQPAEGHVSLSLAASMPNFGRFLQSFPCIRNTLRLDRVPVSQSSQLARFNPSGALPSSFAAQVCMKNIVKLMVSKWELHKGYKPNILCYFSLWTQLWPPDANIYKGPAVLRGGLPRSHRASQSEGLCQKMGSELT